MPGNLTAFPSLLIAKRNQLSCFLLQVMEHTTQTALRNILLKSPVDLVSRMACLGLLLVSPAILFVPLYSKHQIHCQAGFCHYSKIIVHYQA